MEFGWSETDKQFFASARDFARTRLCAEDRRGPPPPFSLERFQLCGEFGLLGLSAPSAFGGLGLGALSAARVFEGFAEGARDPGLLFAAAAHLFACVMPIVECGSDGLKATLLPGLCRGTLVGANAITEAEAGSDVFALKTRAAKDGDDYVLNGTKSYVTNGPVADVIIAYAVTNPSHGYLGISAFAVEASMRGLVRGDPFEKIGLRNAKIGQIYFENCRVPASHRLGAEGTGAAVFNASMLWERACLFALYLGVMESQLEDVIEYARARKQGNRSIGKYQAVSHRIVDMKLRLEAARLLLYRACWQFDAGLDAHLDVFLSKLAVSEAAVSSSLDAVRVHGGIGVMTEAGIEAGVRDAIPSLIFSGTSEIQRDLIARQLGL
jgi:L-prolyl-PCP dehydrogenase